MADQTFSWGSLATNILPAAVGALMGSRRGGMGAIPGAAYGFASGVRSGMEADMQRQEIERRHALESAKLQQGQQRIDLDSQRLGLDRDEFAARKERWAAQDRAAEDAMKTAELERRRIKLDLDQAARSEESFTKFRSTISDPAELAFLDRDPKGYLAKRYERANLAASGSVLETFVTGIKPGQGQQLAEVLGANGVRELIESSLRARSTPKKNFDFKPSVEAGGGFLVNELTGDVIFKRFDNMTPGLKQDLTAAHQIMTEARQQVEAQFRGPMGQMDLSSLGKTAEERAERFQRMINSRATQLATDRGLPNLFSKSQQSLESRVLEKINNGDLKSESDLLAWFAAQGANDPRKLATAVLKKFTQGGPAQAGNLPGAGSEY